MSSNKWKREREQTAGNRSVSGPS